jgi:(p)ppGpp synthase/HD superfamily hydrolase
LWSLYQKLQRRQIDNNLSKVYDLVALRIIVNTIEECYKVLGIVHKLWRPLPDYVRDFIAVPKPNDYRSLHTTVFAKEGRLVEIQIRTWEMHDQAEAGIAAHWHYAEKKEKKTDEEIERGF